MVPELKKKKERGGLVPVMKGFAALKQEFEILKQKVAEIEQKTCRTDAKIDGILTSTLGKCPECNAYIDIKEYGQHYIKMHVKRVSKAEFDAEFHRLLDEYIVGKLDLMAPKDEQIAVLGKFFKALKNWLIEKGVIVEG